MSSRSGDNGSPHNSDGFDRIICGSRVFDLNSFFNERAQPRRSGSVDSFGLASSQRSTSPRAFAFYQQSHPFMSDIPRIHPIHRELSSLGGGNSATQHHRMYTTAMAAPLGSSSLSGRFGGGGAGSESLFSRLRDSNSRRRFLFDDIYNNEGLPSSSLFTGRSANSGPTTPATSHRVSSAEGNGGAVLYRHPVRQQHNGAASSSSTPGSGSGTPLSVSSTSVLLPQQQRQALGAGSRRDVNSASFFNNSASSSQQPYFSSSGGGGGGGGGNTNVPLLEPVTDIPVFHIVNNPQQPSSSGTGLDDDAALRSGTGKIISPSIERIKQSLLQQEQQQKQMMSGSVKSSGGPDGNRLKQSSYSMTTNVGTEQQPISNELEASASTKRSISRSNNSANVPSLTSNTNEFEVKDSGRRHNSLTSNDYASSPVTTMRSFNSPPTALRGYSATNSPISKTATPGGQSNVFNFDTSTVSKSQSGTLISPSLIKVESQQTQKFNCHRCKRVIEETSTSSAIPSTIISSNNLSSGAINAFPALHAVFHRHCFHCYECDVPLLRGGSVAVNSGDDLTASSSGQQGNVEVDYFYVNHRLLCAKCSTTALDKCHVCNQTIRERLIRSLGHAYHPACFRCSVCGLCLDSSAFTFDIHNRIYCLEDFHRAYAPKCAQCNRPITPMEGRHETKRVVAKNLSYHLECFGLLVGIDSGGVVATPRRTGIITLGGENPKNEP